MSFADRITKFFMANDGKPLLISAIIQRDDCSRLLGYFGEKHLPKCSALAIVWKNGTGETYVETSSFLKDDEAIGMLIKAAHRIGADSGKSPSNLFKP